jgi:hypothetical protein
MEQTDSRRLSALRSESPSNSSTRVPRIAAIGGSLAVASVMLFLDVVVNGSYLFSCLICPVWFVVAAFRGLIGKNWRLALLRIAMPILTLAIILGNSAIQWNLAEAKAVQIIAACEKFSTDSGRYPKNLNELVPKYLPSIPRAKCCFLQGDFMYYDSQESAPILWWYKIPPFGKEVYGFRDGQWRFID